MLGMPVDGTVAGNVVMENFAKQGFSLLVSTPSSSISLLKLYFFLSKEKSFSVF